MSKLKKLALVFASSLLATSIPMSVLSCTSETHTQTTPISDGTSSTGAAATTADTEQENFGTKIDNIIDGTNVFLDTNFDKTGTNLTEFINNNKDLTDKFILKTDSNTNTESTETKPTKPVQTFTQQYPDLIIKYEILSADVNAGILEVNVIFSSRKKNSLVKVKKFIIKGFNVYKNTDSTNQNQDHTSSTTKETQNEDAQTNKDITEAGFAKYYALNKENIQFVYEDENAGFASQYWGANQKLDLTKIKIYEVTTDPKTKAETKVNLREKFSTLNFIFSQKPSPKNLIVNDEYGFINGLVLTVTKKNNTGQSQKSVYINDFNLSGFNSLTSLKNAITTENLKYIFENLADSNLIFKTNSQHFSEYAALNFSALKQKIESSSQANIFDFKVIIFDDRQSLVKKFNFLELVDKNVNLTYTLTGDKENILKVRVTATAVQDSTITYSKIFDLQPLSKFPSSQNFLNNLINNFDEIGFSADATAKLNQLPSQLTDEDLADLSIWSNVFDFQKRMHKISLTSFKEPSFKVELKILPESANVQQGTIDVNLTLVSVLNSSVKASKNFKIYGFYRQLSESDLSKIIENFDNNLTITSVDDALAQKFDNVSKVFKSLPSEIDLQQLNFSVANFDNSPLPNDVEIEYLNSQAVKEDAAGQILVPVKFSSKVNPQVTKTKTFALKAFVNNIESQTELQQKIDSLGKLIIQQNSINQQKPPKLSELANDLNFLENAQVYANAKNVRELIPGISTVEFKLLEETEQRYDNLRGEAYFNVIFKTTNKNKIEITYTKKAKFISPYKDVTEDQLREYFNIPNLRVAYVGILGENKTAFTSETVKNSDFVLIFQENEKDFAPQFLKEKYPNLRISYEIVPESDDADTVNQNIINVKVILSNYNDDTVKVSKIFPLNLKLPDTQTLESVFNKNTVSLVFAHPSYLLKQIKPSELKKKQVFWNGLILVDAEDLDISQTENWTHFLARSRDVFFAKLFNSRWPFIQRKISFENENDETGTIDVIFTITSFAGKDPDRELGSITKKITLTGLKQTIETDNALKNYVENNEFILTADIPFFQEQLASNFDSDLLNFSSLNLERKISLVNFDQNFNLVRNYFSLEEDFLGAEDDKKFLIKYEPSETNCYNDETGTLNLKVTFLNAETKQEIVSKIIPWHGFWRKETPESLAAYFDVVDNKTLKLYYRGKKQNFADLNQIDFSLLTLSVAQVSSSDSTMALNLAPADVLMKFVEINIVPFLEEGENNQKILKAKVTLTSKINPQVSYTKNLIVNFWER
ncbi:lipoprotein 17-related variable surface protein [Mycoplasmopsis columbinasalis]|uniref:Lipoprotein associated domain n=1 Tax=Mycoplasmopsis columbinasalis TaxID=114880 RepID=A0A449B9G0_9BACT|nr:lipoprotein 17-related variable surface protein [Mycoplasmopsis columbinasalis]VEU77819.1 Uncharacterised protein [Mycoplasmopsis columbinasalis]